MRNPTHSFVVSPFDSIRKKMSNTTSEQPLATMKQKYPRKQLKPRTLQYRAMAEFPCCHTEGYDVPLNDIGDNNITVYGWKNSEYALQFPSNIQESDFLWVNHNNDDCWWMFGHFQSLGEPEVYFYLNCIHNQENSWDFELHIHSSNQPILCHAMPQHIYELYIRDTYKLCDCGINELACMDGMCADCYWEEDYQRKQRRRNFYYNNPDLHHAWAAHCGQTFFPNEEIIVSPLLRAHIPKDISVDSPEYNSYIEKFKIAIKDGMDSVLSLLNELNPEYTPKY